jgi:hypothetical protein
MILALLLTGINCTYFLLMLINCVSYRIVNLEGLGTVEVVGCLMLISQHFLWGGALREIIEDLRIF